MRDKNCFIYGTEWIKKIHHFLTMLSIDNHVVILKHLANHTCQIPNRSLLEEINAYYKKRIMELQQQINIIQTMMDSADYNDIKEVLIKKRNFIQTKLNKTKLQIIDKNVYKDKIDKIKRSTM